MAKRRRCRNAFLSKRQKKEEERMEKREERKGRGNMREEKRGQKARASEDSFRRPRLPGENQRPSTRNEYVSRSSLQL